MKKCLGYEIQLALYVNVTPQIAKISTFRVDCSSKTLFCFLFIDMKQSLSEKRRPSTLLQKQYFDHLRKNRYP